MPGSIATGATLRYRCDRGVNHVSTDDVIQVSFLDFIESAGGLWPTRWSEAPGVGLEPTTYGLTVRRAAIAPPGIGAAVSLRITL